MVEFSTVIKQFEQQGEKTGWTYIDIPAEIAEQLKPNNKKSFRVKGKLDNFSIKSIALMPMGGGAFIMAINATMRKGIHKRKGAMLKVKLDVDNSPIELNNELMQCLADDPDALSFFNSLTPGHRKYFSNWIDSAKTIETKTKRIANTVAACSKHFDYGQMIRSLKKDRDELMK